MNWYVEALRKYAVFSGRARRMEYWMFFLFNMIAFVVLIMIDASLGSASSDGQGFLILIYQFAMVIPSLAVGVRRMHDTDHSGWWIIVPFANLVLALIEGTHGPNRFGPDPKAEPEFA